MERFKQFARSNVCVLAFQKKRKANNQLVFGQPRTGIRLGSSAQRALEGAGVWENGVFQAAQIDRCIWNYQTSYQCRADFNCERVRVHHKPTRERGTDRNECEKLRFREKRKELARRRREERKVQGFSEGTLLLHSGGFCVRPSDEAFGQGAMLLLRSCTTPPTEQNLHMVPVDADDDDEESLGIVQLRIGQHCAYPQGDDMDAAPEEPRLSIAADCSTPHSFLFKRLRAQANGFLLQHTSSRSCIHPFEGQEQPKDGTELLLHSDCSQGQPRFNGPDDRVILASGAMLH
eukprot:s2836_g3.t1